MNEGNSGAAPVESTPAYKDRSAGLVIFGILTLLIGCLAGLFVPLILFGQAAVAAKNPGAAMPMSAMLPGALVYAILALVLAWLGIGSILKRRWARALLLIFSWCWLIMGILGCISMAFIMPGIMASIPSAGGTPGHPALPPGAASAVLGVMAVVFGIIFVILPAIWTFFYASRHVKATVEALDPVQRWTDRCPLPVLAVVLWLAFSVPMMLLMIPAYHGVIAFFGIFLMGAPGKLVYLLVAGVWAYAAWALYRLDMRGWWVVFILMCLFAISAVMTFAGHDMTQMYSLMGYPQATLDQLKNSGFLTGNHLVWLMLGGMVPWLGYLLFIRKYLRPPKELAVLAGPA